MVVVFEVLGEEAGKEFRKQVQDRFIYLLNSGASEEGRPHLLSEVGLEAVSVEGGYLFVGVRGN